MTPQTRTVACLGLAQTLAWASSYYLPAMLANSMARDLGVSSPLIFAAFSAALVVSALLGPLAGSQVRQVLLRGIGMGVSRQMTALGSVSEVEAVL
ncbi:MAG: hypothetical protein NTV64_06940, partial [Polaromonas sp.]|nr:hypothetical protein [Polaromonas sp.]